MTAVQLTGGGAKEKRRALDFYPTPAEVTVALLEFLKLPKQRIWEPACGDGAMSKVLEAAGHEVFSTDLRNSGYGVGGVDFLSVDSKVADAIITNPPFAAAEAFIRHALKHSPVVAMVLKSQYWHAQKRAALFEEIPPAWVLPLTWRPDFMNGERGGAPTMEVIWTVWMPGTVETRYRLLRKPQISQDLFSDRIAS